MISDDFLKNTRQLTTVDSNEMFDIITYRPTVSKVPTPEVNKEDIVKSLESPNTRCIGYFENNKLISFLVQDFTPKIPAWHMTVLFTISDSHWNYKKNGLEYCWANAMQYAESKNIYRVFWAMPASWARTQTRTIKTSDVWQRYEIYLEQFVPPGIMPSYDEYKVSYGKKIKPHDVVIKQGLLKNEFRKFNQQV
jgi:hypothetical protein